MAHGWQVVGHDPITSRSITEHPVAQRDLLPPLRDEAQLRPVDVRHRHRQGGRLDKRHMFERGDVEAILRNEPFDYRSDFLECFHGADCRMREELLQREPVTSGGSGRNLGASGSRSGIAAHHSVGGGRSGRRTNMEQTWQSIISRYPRSHSAPGPGATAARLATATSAAALPKKDWKRSPTRRMPPASPSGTPQLYTEWA